MPAPMIYTWDGEALRPLPHFVRSANRAFVVGARYKLAEERDRSQASHNHFFAAVAEAWRQLPEDIAPEYPSPEALRKRALIQCGYYDEEIIDCESDEVARQVAAFVSKRDDFAMVFPRGTFVIVRTAKSQSKAAMGNKLFQETKDAVLSICANLVGVKVEELTKEAGRAA